MIEDVVKKILGCRGMVRRADYKAKIIDFEYKIPSIGSGSSTAARSKMEYFVIIVNSWKPLTIIRTSSILDVAAVLDQHLTITGLVTNATLYLKAREIENSIPDVSNHYSQYYSQY